MGNGMEMRGGGCRPRSGGAEKPRKNLGALGRCSERRVENRVDGFGLPLYEAVRVPAVQDRRRRRIEKTAGQKG